jgi:UDP-N-acetyl-2-amino-2-deoxyglucuronate dehydrogenase
LSRKELHIVTEAEKTRFAVVGAGVIGQWHAKTIEELGPRAVLSCVVDRDPSATARAADRYGVRVYATLPEALEESGSDVDVVAVCVPSGIHADVAVQALDAGKHVVIEKPIDITLAAIDRIADAKRRSGRLATVISQHRFDSSTRIVLKALRDGKLGKLTSGVVTASWWRSQAYYDSGGWRGTLELDGGGALMNQTVHSLDLLLAAFGSPTEVFAYSATLAHERIEVEDVLVAAVKFSSGAIATVHATTAAYPGVSARLQIHGDAGSAIIDNDDLVYIHTGNLSPGGNYGSQADAENQRDAYADELSPTPIATGASNPTGLSEAHRLQYEDFLNVLQGGTGEIVTVEQGRLAVATILAIYQSARDHRPVRLSESER